MFLWFPYFVMNLLSSLKKESGSALMMVRSSSGWSANRIGTGPLRPSSPSKSSVEIGHTLRMFTATSSWLRRGFELINAAGSGSDCSCSSSLLPGSTATAQRREAPFCAFVDSFLSWRRRAFRLSTPPSVRVTFMDLSAMLKLKNLIISYTDWIFWVET